MKPEEQWQFAYQNEEASSKQNVINKQADEPLVLASCILARGTEILRCSDAEMLRC